MLHFCQNIQKIEDLLFSNKKIYNEKTPRKKSRGLSTL